MNLYTYMSYKPATGRIILGHEKARQTYIYLKVQIIKIAILNVHT